LNTWISGVIPFMSNAMANSISGDVGGRGLLPKVQWRRFTLLSGAEVSKINSQWNADPRLMRVWRGLLGKRCSLAAVPSLVRRGGAKRRGGLFKEAKPLYRCSRSAPYLIGTVRL